MKQVHGKREKIKYNNYFVKSKKYGSRSSLSESDWVILIICCEAKLMKYVNL